MHKEQIGPYLVGIGADGTLWVEFEHPHKKASFDPQQATELFDYLLRHMGEIERHANRPNPTPRPQ